MEEIEAAGIKMNETTIVLNQENEIINGDRIRDYVTPMISFNKIADLCERVSGRVYLELGYFK